MKSIICLLRLQKRIEKIDSPKIELNQVVFSAYSFVYQKMRKTQNLIPPSSVDPIRPTPVMILVREFAPALLLQLLFSFPLHPTFLHRFSRFRTKRKDPSSKKKKIQVLYKTDITCEERLLYPSTVSLLCESGEQDRF